MNYYLTLKRQFSWSLLLHLLVIASLVFSWPFIFNKPKELKQNSKTFVQAYAYSSTPFVKGGREPQASGGIFAEKIKSKIPPSPPFSKGGNNQRTFSKEENNNNNDALLKILHNAIAANQQYPEKAAELGQTGTVKIGFLLEPTGKIINPKIIKSSGIAELDSAALLAVQTLPAITGIEQYLSTTKFFAIDVEFAES